MDRNKSMSPGVEDANEVFQRVWKRVMPDEKNCPIVVTPVGKKAVQSQSDPAGQTGQAEVKTAKPAATPVRTVQTGVEKEASKLAKEISTGAKEVTKAAKEVAGAAKKAAAAAKDAVTGAVSEAKESAEKTKQLHMMTAMEKQALRGELAPIVCGCEHLGATGAAAATTAATKPTGLVPATATAAPQSGDPMQVHVCDDYPAQTAVPWLGDFGPSFEDLLQEMIQKELTDWHYYRSLGRKAGGTVAKTFANMAAEEWQCAKRLSAAYFLSSGIRFWPEKTGAVRLPSYLSALRERFLTEQQDAEYYSAAATECMDPCLCEIFGEIADLNRRHAQQVRILVEQL